MKIQNQVGRSLRGNLGRLRDVLDGAVSQDIDSLRQVADRVCEAFDLRDGRGRWQRASYCAVLADLEAAGHVSLPRPRHTVGELRDLALVRVETDEQRRFWNTLMAYEHPRGAGPFVGPQLRYLVSSAHGWLGGVGFAACARRLRARDACVGWDDGRRRSHLHRVLGLCRLLVRPGVGCRNLASHVLGRAARMVGDDFEHLHGYRPWLLETFVDAESWASHEFGGAPLGDVRLSARLIQSAQHLAQRPHHAITGATNGARALVKGHYRLIDQPADSAVTVDHILAPHRERTLQRMPADTCTPCWWRDPRGMRLATATDRRASRPLADPAARQSAISPSGSLPADNLRRRPTAKVAPPR